MWQRKFPANAKETEREHNSLPLKAALPEITSDSIEILFTRKSSCLFWHN
jgi:hypothetical protein